jgi:integrase/recombinase XerD
MERTIEAFLSYLSQEKGFSPNTIAAYRNDLSQFMTYVKEQSTGEDFQPPWSTVDRQLILSCVLDIKGRKYASSTVARKLAAIKSFSHFLVREGILAHDPTEDISGPRVGRQLPKTIPVAEFKELLRQASNNPTLEGQRDLAMLELLYATGMRVSELVSLNIGDVNLEEGFVCCYGKRGKERRIPIHGQAVSALGSYIEKVCPLLGGHGEGALFLNRRGQRLTRQGFWLNLKNYVRKAGLEDKITSHTLRHSVATHLLHNGKMNLRELQDFLGHANISTTQVYTYIGDDREVYERTHPDVK